MKRIDTYNRSFKLILMLYAYVVILFKIRDIKKGHCLKKKKISNLFIFKKHNKIISSIKKQIKVQGYIYKPKRELTINQALYTSKQF